MKSLILTFVFAAISCSGAFAQNISRPAQNEKPKQEQKTDKSAPTNASPGTRTPSSTKPGAETPTTRPSGEKEVEQGEKGRSHGEGKKPGKGRKKGQEKGRKVGHHKDGHEAHGNHEGHHDHDGTEAEGNSKNKAKKTKPEGRVPAEAPKSRTPQKQGEKN